MKAGFVIEEFDSVISGYGNVTEKKLSPLQAIKQFCLECQGGHEFPWRCSNGTVLRPLRPTTEVKECDAHTCFLYPFREGHNPTRRRSQKGSHAPV